MPFELVVGRMCEKYNKLPAEILEMDNYWFHVLLTIHEADIEREEQKERVDNIKQKAKENGFRY